MNLKIKLKIIMNKGLWILEESWIVEQWQKWTVSTPTCSTNYSRTQKEEQLQLGFSLF
jgi:hypothetical protein